jgi:hypothetical protein
VPVSEIGFLNFPSNATKPARGDLALFATKMQQIFSAAGHRADCVGLAPILFAEVSTYSWL